MNEKLKIVQNMERIAENIEIIEGELEKLEKQPMSCITKITLDYTQAIDEEFPASSLRNTYHMGQVVFRTPNGQDAQKFVDYIKRAYSARLEAYYEALSNYAGMLKNAPSSATNTEQGNATR